MVILHIPFRKYLVSVKVIKGGQDVAELEDGAIKPDEILLLLFSDHRLSQGIFALQPADEFYIAGYIFLSLLISLVILLV